MDRLSAGGLLPRGARRALQRVASSGVPSHIPVQHSLVRPDPRLFDNLEPDHFPGPLVCHLHDRRQQHARAGLSPRRPLPLAPVGGRPRHHGGLGSAQPMGVCPPGAVSLPPLRSFEPVSFHSIFALSLFGGTLISMSNGEEKEKSSFETGTCSPAVAVEGGNLHHDSVSHPSTRRSLFHPTHP